jgi:HEXXH motif-containing protein
MPKGRLPRDPARSVRRVLATIQDELVARLVLQWAIDGAERPARAGSLALHPRYSPSWGSTSHSLLLGRGRVLLVGEAPLPVAWRFEWDARGYRLASSGRGPPIVLSGRFTAPGHWSIRAPEREVQIVPYAGPWPLLPPVIDEDGARAKPIYPAPGSRAFRGALLAEAPAQADRIDRARAVLAAAWPEGARTVDAFTRAIIPVTQPEVVSYSFAPVPGWSYINLYDRDFIDLIDDLVHENAHHHLNHILAGSPLLVRGRGTDESLIYYSPWRETLRPLRGILHSVFTFAAGAELFRRLWLALSTGRSLPHEFTKSERRKIAARCLEETLQVRYSLIDLAHAHRSGRLDEHGAALAHDLGSALRRFDRLAPRLWRALKGTAEARRLRRLEKLLDEKRALTRRIDQ